MFTGDTHLGHPSALRSLYFTPRLGPRQAATPLVYHACEGLSFR